MKIDRQNNQPGVFEALYKRLNKAQKQAVDAIEGPVMVIAGPGTGKTSILTLRIANILKQTDTPAHGILALTYTDAGVKAMRLKLHNIIGNRAHEVYIHTFHSFAVSIISEYQDHFLHLQGLKQMTEVEQESLINSIITEPSFSKLRPLGKPDAYLTSIIRSIDNAKRSAMTPAMVKEYALQEIGRINKDEAYISTRGVTKGKLKALARELIEKCERTVLFSQVYDLYEIKKREAKRLDFNDLIIELLVTLRNDELLLRLVQERFLYIHIDEHQDTNDAQNSIILLIAEFFDTPNIFIVGDEKQAIYRFQGASFDNFFNLQKHWSNMKIIPLETNYRSHQSILDASFSMIENNYEDEEHKNLRIKLKSDSGEESKPIEIITAENASSADLHLIRELKAIEENNSQSTVAIIVRRNRDVDRIIRLLESNKISFSSERSIDIFTHPIGRLFFDLIEYISDQTRLDALARTVSAQMWNMRFEDSIRLIKLLSSQKEFDAPAHIPALKEITSQLYSDSSVNFIIHSAEKSGFVNIISKDPSYVHVWRGIVALAESLTRESNISDPRELIKNMLAYRASAESRPIKVTVGAPDMPFRVITAHGSKGLEFDYVFLPYAVEESWIGKTKSSSFVLPKKQSDFNDIQDLRRLFYVALTRARKDVKIISPLEESDGKILTPLRFISELDDKHITRTSLSRENIEEFLSKTTPADPKSKLTDVCKHILLEKGLSVTALNHFITCPNQFLYQSILKLPQVLTASGEKGNAMHFAIAKVWASPRKSIEEIQETISNGLIEYLNESFLSLAEKEAVKKELLENSLDVAKAMASHFMNNKSLGEKSILTEHWVEGTFEGYFDKKIVHIPIHGQLDAIVQNASEVEVFDYKTKQAMSIASIKGETKNSDGNYFRQLVFYKILMERDSRWKGKNIIPSLVFISPDEKGRCPIVSLPISKSDIEKVKEEIQSLIDMVWKGNIPSAKCSDRMCRWCGLASISSH